MKWTALLSVVLVGCATPDQPMRMETKLVPVAVNCLRKVPVDPAYTYPSVPAGQSKQQALALVADLELAKQYGRDWKASAAGCMSLPDRLDAP